MADRKRQFAAGTILGGGSRSPSMAHLAMRAEDAIQGIF